MEATIIQDLLNIFGSMPARKKDANLACEGVFSAVALKNYPPYGRATPNVILRCPQQKCDEYKTKLATDIRNWAASHGIVNYGAAPDEDALLTQLDSYYNSASRNNPQLVIEAFAHVESQLPALCDAIDLIFQKRTSMPDECEWLVERVYAMNRIIDYVYRSSPCFGTLEPDTIHKYRCWGVS